MQRCGRCARIPRVASPRKLDSIALRLGTRGSPLALAQAGYVADRLGDVAIVPIRTAGDERPKSRGASETRSVDAQSDRAGDSPPDKSRFVSEIERALLDGEVDLAVHSAKDLPLQILSKIGEDQVAAEN